MDAVATAPDPLAALWQRVASLRFRLVDSVSVDALDYRGGRWYLLRNVFNRQQLRLNEHIYGLLEQLDGRHTLAQVIDGLPGMDGESPQRRQEVLTVLTQLQAAGMLSSDAPADVATLLAQQRQQHRRQRIARWLRPLSPRFSLFAPDRFLQRYLPLVRWMLHPAAMLLWFAIAAFAGLQALMAWDALALYGAQRLDDPAQWVLLVCLYPLVKGLHELGHGFVARAYGAEVSEMGITLLVFLPVPYVDATAASALADKYQRMLVGAAGILVELMLAALALFAWQSLDDGLLREIAFGVMLIGGISTLLFNGNPLLRFDGYYVLSDAIEIPNLATRAGRYYGYLARRYLLGVSADRSPVTADGERRWFLFYGLASTLYRYAISIGIALFLIATLPVVGVVLAAWLLGAQLLLPLGRQLHYLAFNPALKGHRLRALGVAGGLLLLLLAMLAWLPLPSRTQVDGIVLLPEQAVVRAEVEGFLAQQIATDGMAVRQGELLFRLANPELDADVAALEARVRELEARRDALAFDERVAREIEAERLAEVREELDDLRGRQELLIVRSPADGVIKVATQSDKAGRFVDKGDMLAYLSQPDRHVVQVVATEEDARRIREGVVAIEVRLAGARGEALVGQLTSEVPLGTETLPSAALGSQAGGPIPVDARDPAGRTTLKPVFVFDVQVPASRAGGYVGGRAFVRFEHSSAPLLSRWYEAARRHLIDEIGE